MAEINAILPRRVTLVYKKFDNLLDKKLTTGAAALFYKCVMMRTEDVMWTCKFHNGTIKRFKFPVRTTPEGMANAYSDLKGKDLESNLLSTQKADGYEIPRPKTVA